MFGRVITSYLIAIVLAGPGLCCCSFARDCAPAGRSHGCKVAAHTCCHSETDRQLPGKPDTCPCRKHHEQPIVSLDGSSPSSDEFRAVQWQPDFEIAVLVINGFVGISDPNHLAAQALDSPYLNSRAILRALSVMRC